MKERRRSISAAPRCLCRVWPAAAFQRPTTRIRAPATFRRLSMHVGHCFRVQLCIRCVLDASHGQTYLHGARASGASGRFLPKNSNFSRWQLDRDAKVLMQPATCVKAVCVPLDVLRSKMMDRNGFPRTRKAGILFTLNLIFRCYLHVRSFICTEDPYVII